jgi:hypothetical protein
MSDQKNNVFCSRECYEKSRNKRVITICKFCNKEISDTVFRAKVRVYCSEKCKYAHLSVIRSELTGKKNPCFIHGKSRSAKYRQQAFDAYPHHCNICQKKDCRLEVHHIDYDPKNDEIENLQILCCSCHIKHHRSSCLSLA